MSDLAGLAIRHAVYPVWVAKNRSARLRYHGQLERSQYWSREQLVAHQWKGLVEVIKHAFEFCPYYRQKYKAAGLHPGDLRSPQDLVRIPSISKEEIQEHGPELLSDAYRNRAVIWDMTGGSTGKPMRFAYDADRRDWREAAALRHDYWTGWRIGDRRALLWGAPRDTALSGRLGSLLREQLIERRLMLDASSLDDEAMNHFAQQLIHYKPRILLAYANTLGLFASFVAAERIQGIRPLAIITSAEVLTAETRQLAEQTFGCRVFDRYGSREFGVVASECEQHRRMHINAENLLVESTAADQTSELLITDLRNLAMPMIRYAIGDTGRLVQEQCPCSRGLPLLELSGGRVTDFLKTLSGKRVSGIVLATYAITNVPGIRQIQFVQNDPGLIVINLARGPNWSAGALGELNLRLKEFLGNDMQFEVVYRESIGLEKSGKYRFSVCSV